MVAAVSNSPTPLNLSSANSIGGNSLGGLSSSEQMNIIKQLLNEIEALLQAQQGGSGGSGSTGGTGGTGAPPANSAPSAGNGGAQQPNAQPLPGGNNLTQIGSALQQGDAQTGMTNFKNSDPVDFENFQNALSKGDGNAASEILAHAVSSGKVSQTDGAKIGAQLQQTAYANGGGQISDHAGYDLQQALGGNVLTR
ncbi:hypothetical protein [Paraburkholderia megapolitana]|jgi:hypothetical protein|uniref:Uncharacterized protein n=1 Tax=Paraburkholderia megapolitana TaxID=420953 RepID=A0A1I3DT56_9BURK|nr:hypothetical protein [Paraburkholderia megapolitana]QDQ79760.1 hypothetical protein FNZ07_00430 [Paraburkholderia megapolitana]SFH89906.1 hypothetical protein SAMN05192543_101510 [Paraburkholderia megapolitana]